VPENKNVIEVAWLDDHHLLLVGGNGWMPSLWVSDQAAKEWRPLTQDFAIFNFATLTHDRMTAAVTRSERRSGIWLADASGSRMTMAVPETPSGATQPVLTRSGSLFYSVLTGQRLYEVHRLDVGSSRPVVVARDLGWPGAFAISADEQFVVFGGGKPPFSLYRTNRDGSSTTELVKVANGPAVTKDNQVLFSRDGPGLYSVPLMGGEPRLLNSTTVLTLPAISPDERQVLFVGDTQSSVIRCDLPDWNVTKLTVRSAIWAPDGLGVAYVNENDGGNIWEQPFDGGPHRPLTKIDNAAVLESSWSPDGQRLALARGKRLSDIVLIKGLNVRQPD
jgi:Tol biopolymer transport system component